ncbi:hypothetical protein QL285_051605 [Trifolium repens]|nr:hypothetical protein QL285_051605 [Trifolium repens]
MGKSPREFTQSSMFQEWVNLGPNLSEMENQYQKVGQKSRKRGKTLQMPNRLGQDNIHRGRFSLRFQDTQAMPDKYMQPLGPELVSGININHHSTKDLDTRNTHYPP